MKKFLLLTALLGLLTLTSCGSTENCRSRQSAYNYQHQSNNDLVSNLDVENKK